MQTSERAPVLTLLLLLAASLSAQDPPSQERFETRLQALHWREVGPMRGGRCAAVTGVPGKRQLYYMGTAGGGVWKTQDGGLSWRNISDGSFGGSIGAVAVSSWDPNVIYVGGGEKTIRGNVSHGDGVYKSTDAGRSWKAVGLPESRHICRLRIHPRNPDLVYAACLGHLFGPNEERGVYRTKDGGQSWERILFVNPDSGAVDLVMDPSNPRILYASLWRVRRTPHSLESGGEGSGLWKSTDGGDTWVDLSRKPGMPRGTRGICGITVAASRPDTLYAIIEAEDGGVFRSTDGGESWSRQNSERKLRQRAWYYSRISADPADSDVVYVLNVGFHRSKDGGKTFQRIRTPHGDNHDLWIDPQDPKRMIESNDGGANVTTDGGQTWTRQDNQPTAQLYRVSVDDAVPYHLLAGQQDNSAFRIRSQPSMGSRLSIRDWETTAGGESGHVVAKPGHPELVFGGSYGGYLSLRNHRSGERRSVNVWPDNPMGWGAAQLKYRFQWNYPLLFSRHNPKRLYAAANVLFKSEDDGASWQAISGDLSYNDKSKQGPSGGPITKDNTSIEYYCTIFAVAESRREAGVIWTGSDDGRIFLTRDDGKSWNDVTPPQLPKWTQINSIEAHPFENSGLYVAATRYKLDDFRPYLLKTTDWGKTWTTITAGIAPQHFTRVVRADPDRRGLLFAGTERGLYYSVDDGARWETLQIDLPIVPISDLAINKGQLIAATQGRGFWILDDLSVLHQASEFCWSAKNYLFTPRVVERVNSASGQLELYYHLGEEPDPKTPITLEIRQADGSLVKSFQRQPPEGADDQAPPPGSEDTRKLSANQGLNRFRWDLRYPRAETLPGLILWNASGLRGPKALPGDYELILRVGDWTAFSSLKIAPDPRSSAAPKDLEAQFRFLMAGRDQLSLIHRSLKTIRPLRTQLQELNERLTEHPKILKSIDSLLGEMSAIEKALYQTKNRSRQDPLNFPIRLNDKLAGLLSSVAQGDFAPTAQARLVAAELAAKIETQIERLRGLIKKRLPLINQQVKETGIPALSTPAIDAADSQQPAP